MLDTPGFKSERCVRYRYTYSECKRCADACPHGAIRLFDAGVEVLASQCQSCGLCVSACQTEALIQPTLSADHLRTLAGDAAEFTLACTPSQAKGDASVPCLGALHPVVLTELTWQGIAVELVGASHCPECAHAAKATEMIRSNLEACELLRACGKPEAHAVLTLRSDDADESGQRQRPDMSRRNLFRRAIGHGADVMAGRFEPTQAPLKVIRAAAPFLPDRKVLLNAMFAAEGEAPITMPRHEAIPAEDWQVAAGCTYCEACARVCPTGAIQLLENNTGWRLAFLNDRCVACDVCAEVCQPGAMRQSESGQVLINKQKGRLLAGVSKTRCLRCDRVFVNEGHETICPICRGDDDDFSSIFG